MNHVMKAAAKVVAAAQETVSEAHRSILDDEARIPVNVFDRLTDAILDYDNEVAKTFPAPAITREQDWWKWFLGEEDEDGPSRNQRMTRLMRRET